MIKLFALLVLGTLSLSIPSQAYACPNQFLPGTKVTASGQALWDKIELAVMAGGSEDITVCPIPFQDESGPGYIESAPDFKMDLSSLENYALEFRVDSLCDSILVVKTGAGFWFYDDDDNGNQDAKIRLTSPRNGTFDVWVGSYDGDYCDATLEVETY